MVIKRDFYFTPKKTPRRLHIWLPDDYDKSDERYPVMYFFDGHNLFFNEDATYGKSWGLYDFLSNWEKQIIIVGIECGHEGAERLTEYCPYHFKSGFLGEIYGTGVETLNWICEEVKPMIDDEYRTWSHREATAIGGSSMGGLMSLFAAVRYADTFSKAACLSSTIGPCMTDFEADIAHVAAFPDTRVYLSYGTVEAGGDNAAQRRSRAADLVRRNELMAAWLSAKGAVTRVFAQEGGHHCEADWEKQVSRFMNFLWLDR